MSATSQLYAEIWRNDRWEPIPSPKKFKGKDIPVCYVHLGTTEYELYAALAGYYRPHLYHVWHTEEIAPLSKPRGLPKNMNSIYAQNFEDNMAGRYCITWFMVQEVIDYDWDRKFPVFIGHVKSQYAHLFSALGSFPEGFPEDGHIYTIRKEGTTEVSWVDSYREFVGCVDWFIEKLLKLGNPTEVRIIFWLE